MLSVVDADVGVRDLPVRDQLVDRVLRRVDRNREADAAVVAGAVLAPDLGVDADHAPARVEAAGRRSCRA